MSVIKSIKLTNFRNYKNFHIPLGQTTVLVGPNGIGKTNIIEAISMLSYTKSFRAKDEKNLIMENESFAQIIGKLKDNKKMIFVISKNNTNIKKQVSIDHIKKKLTEVVGKIKIVLFSPESLKIIIGPPTERRRFIDIICSQVDKKYLDSLMQFRHILKQRNSLLKHICLHRNNIYDQLDFWDKKLIKYCTYIIKQRLKTIKFFEKQTQEIYSHIFPHKKVILKIIYDPKIPDIDKIDELIASARNREIEAQKTLYGPHLDDIKILINSQTASDVSSRGEIRSIIFCLKLAEIKYLESLNNKSSNILLLLDDIFSELDFLRRKEVLNLVKDKQTIITTTDAESINPSNNNIKIINLEQYGKNQ